MHIQGIEYPVNHRIIARAKDAPKGFSCKNCEYWDKSAKSCGEEHIIDLAKDPDNIYHIGVIDDMAHPLHAGDCCDFFEKKDG